MIDFSKIFDIVFASVGVALMLFLLVSTIAVAARGKRKCGGFDVALRIVSTLVLIVAAVMFAAAILTMLDGSFRIQLDSQATEKTVAYLVINGKQTELPLVELFIVLSSVVGSNLVAMLLICALAALIVDCLVANKKDGSKTKAKASKPQKTPEQLKREAELERIKRIGESAVRKADAAASQDTATTEKQDDEPKTDWREQPKPEEHTEFVGLKDDDSADDFDSFDDVDQENGEAEGVEEEASEAEQQEYTEEEEQLVEDTDDGEAFEEETEAVDEFIEDEPVDEEFVDEPAEEELTQEELSEEEYVEQDEFVDDELIEQAIEDESVEEEVVTEEEAIDEQELVEDETEETAEELVEEQPVEDVAEEDDMSNWAYESDESVTDEEAEQAETEEVDQAEETEAVDSESKEPALDIEPDRNIYIPEMRTIEPAPKAAVKQQTQPAKKPSAKPKAAAKSKKPAPKTQRAVPPEKKLPMTRKYVILDRHNAVNMFGEYLKERNKAQKEKLESSIDTIIIE